MMKAQLYDVDGKSVFELKDSNNSSIYVSYVMIRLLYPFALKYVFEDKSSEKVLEDSNKFINKLNDLFSSFPNPITIDYVDRAIKLELNIDNFSLICLP